eukprot:7893022-Pyramimonas_sp.AAC.2
MVHAAACVGLNLLESISSVDRGWLLDPTPQGMRHELVRMGFGPFEDWEFITSGMHAVRSRPYDQTKVMLGIIKLYEKICSYANKAEFYRLEGSDASSRKRWQTC